MLSLNRQNQWRERYRQAHPGWQPATELFAEQVRTYLPANGRLLDIGCGRGGIVEQLAHPLGQVVGIDPDWQSLTEHRLPLPRVQGISDRLPFSPKQFDVVVASWVLEHLERPLLTFQAIQRVLKPNGVFIFITPNQHHPLSWLNQTLGRFNRLQKQLVERLYQRDGDDTFSTFYRANGRSHIEALCQQSGLQIASLLFVSDPTYLAFSPTLYRASCWLERQLPPHRHIHLVGVIKRPLQTTPP